MPYYDNGYLDPLHIVWRNGTAEDPYVDKIEYIVVANQSVILTEIPDKVSRVRITGLKEVSYEKFTTLKLKSDEFYVNYNTGVIQFHEDMEGLTVTTIYKGRGFIQYPSDRIYHRDKLNNVVVSLSKIIDESTKILNEAEIKIEEVDEKIGETEVAISKTNEATDRANKATEQANVATDKALDAYETTRLVFKPFVQTYEDILTNYPNPEVGWTTMVYDNGIRYRWDGIEWVEIDGLGGNIPLANEVMDGLLSKEDFVKIKDISNEVDVRTVVFVIPQDIMEGVQDPHIMFPYDGEILEIVAYVSSVGINDTPIEVQYSTDFENWSMVTDSPIVINAGNHKDNGLHNIEISTIDEETDEEIVTNFISNGTVFRLNVPTFSVDALNLQVNMKIKIN